MCHRVHVPQAERWPAGGVCVWMELGCAGWGVPMSARGGLVQGAARDCVLEFLE